MLKRILSWGIAAAGMLLSLPAQPGEKYTIEGGDTLSEIADKYGVSYQALGYHNKLPDVDLISIGRVLDIPEPNIEPPPEARAYYTSKWAKQEVWKRWPSDSDEVVIEEDEEEVEDSKDDAEKSATPTCATELSIGASTDSYVLVYSSNDRRFEIDAHGRSFPAYVTVTPAGTPGGLLVLVPGSYILLPSIPPRWNHQWTMHRNQAQTASSVIEALTRAAPPLP